MAIELVAIDLSTCKCLLPQVVDIEFVDYSHNFVAIGNKFMDMVIRHRPRATCTHVI